MRSAVRSTDLASISQGSFLSLQARGLLSWWEMQTDTFMWKLVLAYDGTDFHGWQVQPDRVTVQGELRDALARITGEDVLPQGSGRTDAGVHALGQVASFALAAPIPEANLARALNRTLPASIRVLSATRAGSDFHARHSAQAKTYEYRIFRGEICPPWQARYVYALNAPLRCGGYAAGGRPGFGRARLHLLCRQRLRFTRQRALPPCFAVGSGTSDCFFIACAEMGFSITWCGTWWERFSRWDEEISARQIFR